MLILKLNLNFQFTNCYKKQIDNISIVKYNLKTLQQNKDVLNEFISHFKTKRKTSNCCKS